MTTIKTFTASKTLQEFFEYGKQFEGRKYANKAEIRTAIEKLERMVKAYGFEFYRTFNDMCRPIRRDENTSSYYQIKVGEHGYIRVQLGFLYQGVYERKQVRNRWGRYETKSVRKPDGPSTSVCGVFRVEDNSAPSLNPSTGRPWQIGDIDNSTPGYSRILTERGWYTGD